MRSLPFRKSLTVCLVAAFCLGFVVRAHAFEEVNQAQRVAVEKGLAQLAASQQPNGSFGSQNDENGSITAVTALSALALMEAGNLPNRGKYGVNVQHAVDFILATSQESGLLVGENANSVMYSHGFATLFLGEVYGMTGDEKVKEKLQKAVRLIEKTQNPQGGWRYQPVPVEADISVTICQVMALRAARDGGIKVEKSTIDAAIKYVQGCQNPDGGFNYQLGTASGSAFPRSAAGVATLYYAGISQGNVIQRGLDYISKFRPGNGNAAAAMAASSGHYFYGQYYAMQAMFLAGGKYWETWYPAARDEIISRQAPDGSWRGEVSAEYCTAVALIVLQMPNRYLPVFNGKGSGG